MEHVSWYLHKVHKHMLLQQNDVMCINRCSVESVDSAMHIPSAKPQKKTKNTQSPTVLLKQIS